MPEPNHDETPDQWTSSSAHKFFMLPEMLRFIREAMLRAEFAALCQVSRNIYERANPILYERISLAIYDTSGLRIFRDLQYLFFRHSSLACLVKALHIQFDNIGGKNKLLPDLVLLANLVKMCAELKELYIRYHLLWPLSVFSTFTDSFLQLVSLRSIRFEIDHIGLRQGSIARAGWHSVNEEFLLHLLKNESIESVGLTLHEGPKSPLLLSTLPVNISITRLCLHQAYLEIHTLSRILNAVPSVRHLDVAFFRYGDPPTRHISPYIDFAMLGNTLLPYTKTLETLKFSFDWRPLSAYEIGWGNACGPLGVFPSLRSWEKLTSLEVSPEMLFGWGNGHPDALSRAVPLLQHFHFRWDFGDWDTRAMEFPALCDRVKEYLQTPQGLCLKELGLTCWEDEEKEAEPVLDAIKKQCDAASTHFILKILR